MTICDIEPVYVDGILEVHNLGPNIEVIFFRYQRNPEGGPDIKVAVLPMIRPRDSFLNPKGKVLEAADAQPDPRRPPRMHS